MPPMGEPPNLSPTSPHPHPPPHPPRPALPTGMPANFSLPPEAGLPMGGDVPHFVALQVCVRGGGGRDCVCGVLEEALCVLGGGGAGAALVCT